MNNNKKKKQLKKALLLQCTGGFVCVFFFLCGGDEFRESSECLVDIDAVLGRHFKKGCIILRCKSLALRCADCTRIGTFQPRSTEDNGNSLNGLWKYIQSGKE